MLTADECKAELKNVLFRNDKTPVFSIRVTFLYSHSYTSSRNSKLWCNMINKWILRAIPAHIDLRKPLKWSTSNWIHFSIDCWVCHCLIDQCYVNILIITRSKFLCIGILLHYCSSSPTVVRWPLGICEVLGGRGGVVINVNNNMEMNLMQVVTVAPLKSDFGLNSTLHIHASAYKASHKSWIQYLAVKF